jgi:uncharacterized NAD-dependent epimerase/dehydratase family protein
VALNTSALGSDEEAHEAIVRVETATRLPADDPVRFGSGRLLDVLLDLLSV